MIIEIYSLLFIVAFLFLFYGRYSQTDMYSLFGSFLLIVLGIILTATINSAFGSIQYANGTVATIVGNTTVTATSYATYSSGTVGFFLTLYGMFSFVIILMNNRNRD